MGVSWIKIITSIFDDEKIKIIDSMPDHDAILVIWIKLLTLAGKCNARGCLLISDSLPYTDEMLSAVFSRPLNTVKMALGIFEQLGMICRSDAIQLVNWEKHQNEAALEIIRDNERDRKRIQRSRQRLQITDKKESPVNVPDTVPDMSHDVRILDIELEGDTEREEENKEEPHFSKAEALNPNKKNSEQRFQQLKTAWNANCKPSCTIRGTDTMNYYQREDWLAGESQIVDIFATCKAMQNYGGILGNPEFEIEGHKGYSMLSFLVKGVEWYTDEAKPFDRCRKKQAGPRRETVPDAIDADEDFSR